jgi:integrase
MFARDSPSDESFALVRVKNVSKRLERPSVLTAEEFHKLLPHIREPYRTMVLIAGCLGFRASEIVGLQWGDFDFEKSTLLVQRGVVHGRVDDVETEYSRDLVPIASELAKELLWYRSRCYPTAEGWLFANPATDKPYHEEEIQKKHIRRAAKAAGINLRVGWKNVPAQLSFLAGRDRGAHRRATGTDASRQYSNHDECLRKGHDRQQETSAQQRGSNGPETTSYGLLWSSMVLGISLGSN